MKYVAPEMKIVMFEAEEIIVASNVVEPPVEDLPPDEGDI